jgi:hypothetical protein
MTCASAGKDAAPDATFSFELSEQTKLSVSTAGSEFNPAVAIFNRVIESPAEFYSDDTNETAGQALDLINVTDDWATAVGDTTSMQPDYSVATLGCGMDDSAADAVFRFSLTSDTTVGIDTTGSAFDTTVSLFDTAPALTTQVTTDNTNDDVASPTDVGDVFEHVYSVQDGDTSAAGITPVYTGVQMGCGADDSSPDAVYRFELSEPTRVRMDTAGTSFPVVLSLADGALGSKSALPVPSGNDTQETAFDLGDVGGSWLGLTGTTAGHAPDYRQAFIGCNADTFAPDTVFKLTLNEATRMRFDTSGSGFDTVISLHDGVIDPTTPLTTDNTNETAESPMLLGEVDDSWFEVYGGDTTLMSPSYTESIISCGADTNSADAVFAFDVLNPTRVRIDTIGSTFDTVVSLHDAPPPRRTTSTVPSGTELHPVGLVNDASQIFTGSTEGLDVDYGGESMGCNTEDSPADIAFSFEVDVSTEVEISTEGSDFDTFLGLFPDTIVAPSKPPATPVVGNEEKLTAFPLGTLDGGWAHVSGDTSIMLDDYDEFGCSAFKNSADAAVRFHLDTQRTVHIDTLGSEFDTVIGVFDYATDTLVACDQDSGPNQTSDLAETLPAGDYYVVVTGDRSSDDGAYHLSIRDEAASNVLACNDDAVISGRSRIVAQLMPGTYHVVLKGAREGHEGDFSVRFTDRDWWDLDHRLACDDNSGGGYVSLIEQDLDPGRYYVVLKGDLAVEEGPFRLTVRSLSSTVAVPHTLSCDDDSGDGGGGPGSVLEADLDPGDYWVVVKGKNGESGLYDMEVRDIGAGGQGIVLTCDADSSGDAVIERDLGAGVYYAFVKGDGPTDAGPYNLNLTDVDNTGGAPLECDDDGASGSGGASRIERNLTAGDYWVVLKGKNSIDAGAYSLSVRDRTTASRTMFACTDDESFEVDLEPGFYDAVLKGVPSDEAGNYTLTMGSGETQEALFEPPTWNETLNALRDTETRVITVLNCHDNGLHGEGRDCDFAQAQARTLANATDALGPDLSPLVIDIDSNGTGIENAIMTQLTLLSGHLEMDVSARVVFDPDANPGFLVNVEAIDRPGDGCDGLIGLEHQNCRPGATPTFNISFTNPLETPVPPNPDDPGGGYWFRADLIADGKYFVDAVPIYVVPSDVDGSNEPPEPQLEPTGSYWQDLSSGGCAGNERPDWQDLFWTAEIPDGTGVDFNVCTAETLPELETCSYTHIASVRGEGSCATDADCARGFCAPEGVCQVVSSGNCMDDTQCPAGAYCETATNTCIFAGQPVFVGSVLGDGNLFTYLRMNIELSANTMTNEGPTVHDWALTYLCRNVN